MQRILPWTRLYDRHLPALLSFQELPAHGNLNVQGYLHAQRVLIFLQCVAKLLFGSREGSAEFIQFAFGFVEGGISFLFHLNNAWWKEECSESHQLGPNCPLSRRASSHQWSCTKPVGDWIGQQSQTVSHNPTLPGLSDGDSVVNARSKTFAISLWTPIFASQKWSENAGRFSRRRLLGAGFVLAQTAHALCWRKPELTNQQKIYLFCIFYPLCPKWQQLYQKILKTCHCLITLRLFHK